MSLYLLVMSCFTPIIVDLLQLSEGDQGLPVASFQGFAHLHFFEFYLFKKKNGYMESKTGGGKGLGMRVVTFSAANLCCVAEI